MEINKVYEQSGFSARTGFGKKPALIVIDWSKAFTGIGVSPLAFDQADEIANAKPLLDLFRRKCLPVIFSTVIYSDDLSDGGLFMKKVTGNRYLTAGPGAEVDDRIKPLKSEYLLIKKYPSCFFGTTLSSILLTKGVDTTILTGCSTSGCVRATCVDSMCSGFHTIIPKECVADRHPDAHNQSLFDMDAKYADVMPVSEVIDYIESHY